MATTQAQRDQVKALAKGSKTLTFFIEDGKLKSARNIFRNINPNTSYRILDGNRIEIQFREKKEIPVSDQVAAVCAAGGGSAEFASEAAVRVAVFAYNKKHLTGFTVQKSKGIVRIVRPDFNACVQSAIAAFRACNVAFEEFSEAMARELNLPVLV